MFLFLDVASPIPEFHLIKDKNIIVSLKIVENKINLNKNFFPKIKNQSKIEEKMNKVKDNELKSSLNNFLKAFDERNK